MAFPDAAEAPKKKASLIAPSLADADDATTVEDESTEDSSAAAGEVFDALKSDDREGFITALKAAMMSSK